MTKARDLANVISGSGTLNANVIPALPASKITSGTFADARLSSSSVTQHVDLTSLSASNLTSGTVPSARLSLSASDVPDLATSKITSGTFADARLSASSVTQHVDLSNLNASNLTSGSIPNARVPSSAVTQHVSAVTNQTGSWSPGFNNFSADSVNARYVKVGRSVQASVDFRRTGNTNTDSLAYISGLPFTSLNAGYIVGGGVFSGHHAYGSSYGAIGIVFYNQTRIYFRNHESDNNYSSAGADNMWRGNDFNNTAYYTVTVNYIANS